MMTYRSVISSAQGVLSFFGASIALFVYVEKTRTGDVPCVLGYTGCTNVTTGPYSHIGPIDVSLLGAAAYVAILLLAIVKGTSVGDRPAGIIRPVLLAITLLGFGFSWYLQWLSKYVIHDFCIYCRTSAIIMTLLFALAAVELAIEIKSGRSSAGVQIFINEGNMTTSTKVWISVVLVALIGVYEWLLEVSHGHVAAPASTHSYGQDDAKSAVGQPGYARIPGCKPERGSSAAPWTLIEIGDFECPQCGKVHSSVEKLVDNSQGKVKLYFLNWPLQMHRNARRAAAAALAAEKQGKFWPMYDAIYNQQKGLDDTSPDDADSTLLGDASNSNLDIHQYEQARKSQEILDRLQQQANLVTSIGTQSTPTFLLRKNNSSTVYFFIGAKGQDPTPGTPAYPGLNLLIANAPWIGGKLPPPPDVAPPGTYKGVSKS